MHLPSAEVPPPILTLPAGFPHCVRAPRVQVSPSLLTLQICVDCSADDIMKGVIKTHIQLSADSIMWCVHLTEKLEPLISCRIICK